jgi:CelD/BcsL family acetyltransferase involved in cellulose biosynthesis
VRTGARAGTTAARRNRSGAGGLRRAGGWCRLVGGGLPTGPGGRTPGAPHSGAGYSAYRGGLDTLNDVPEEAGVVNSSAAEPVPACTVEPVTDYQAFVDLEPLWNRLVDAAGIESPFVRHEAVRAWWECFGQGRELHILVVKAGEEPIALAPLMLCKRRLHGLALNVLEFISNVFVERFDFIVGRWPAEAYRAMWTYLRHRKALWDVLLLHQLPAGSRSAEELMRLAAEDRVLTGLRQSAAAPYLPLVGSWESYFKGLDGKHRSNLRNRLKRLGRLGEARLEVVSSADDLDRALEDGFRLEAAAWKGQAGTAIQTHPPVHRFYTQLAHVAAERGWLRLSFLTLDGRRIAFGYYLQYGNKLYLLKPGYDPEYAPYSPSNLLCYLVLQDAFERGVAELDFLGVADAWKLDWTEVVRPHYCLYVFADRLRTRLLYWTKIRLVPSLKQQRVVRMLSDVVLNRA